MLVKIVFEGGPTVTVGLREERTETIGRLLEALPFSSSAKIWGKEVYFDAPYHADLEEDAKAEMEVGDVAFWPDGDAVAIFFGRTPASVDERPRAYSSCNMIGHVRTDPAVLGRVNQGQKLMVSRA